MSTKEYEALEKYIESVASKKPKKSIDEIERKLSVLLKHMEYDEYLDFLKSEKKLKNLDDMLGMYYNGMLITESMVNSLPEEHLKDIDNYILNKIKELGLEKELDDTGWED